MARRVQVGGAQAQKSGGFRNKFLFIVVFGAGLVVLAAFLRQPGPVSVEFGFPYSGVGPKTKLDLGVRELKRGFGAIEVIVSQGETQTSVFRKTYPESRWWAPFDKQFTQENVEIPLNTKSFKGLKKGPLTVNVLVEQPGALFFGGGTHTESMEAEVKRQPPSLTKLSTHVYIQQGGAELVRYQVGDRAKVHGVQAAGWFFRGFDVPGSASNEKVVLFAAPYDLSDSSKINLVAEDDLGNRVTLPVVDGFTARPYKTDIINVSDNFLKKVVPVMRAQLPDLPEGDLLSTYVHINSKLRTANNLVLKNLTKKTSDKFLWNGPFKRLPGAIRSSFADRRTYKYKDKTVDKQDHLGLDIAETARSSIISTNAGRVVLAEYLGIYGNAVVVDHGLGLMSLYGHMSSITVKDGQTVTAGQSLGRSGATGLALGDHVHFTFMIQGLAVHPVEWWDPTWVKNRIATKADFLNFTESP